MRLFKLILIIIFLPIATRAQLISIVSDSTKAYARSMFKYSPYENRTDTVLGRVIYVKKKTVKTVIVPIIVDYYNSWERGVGKDYRPVWNGKRRKVISIALLGQ